MANRSTILILFLVGICNLQTALAGSNRMIQSEVMLNIQVKRIRLLVSRQVESFMRGFQIASRGEQAKVVIRTLIL